MTATSEGTELAEFTASPPPASVSYTLAHESSRELELRGEYCRAAELLAVALAEEAQRDNQRTLQSLDLTTHADAFKSITVAMAGQRQAANALMVPLLDEREPALLGGCLQAYISNRVSRLALPRPRLALNAIAARWHLPPHEIADEHWRDFVKATGGAFTLSYARARATILSGASDSIALATWRLALTDRVKADLIVLDAEDGSMAAAAAQASAPVAEKADKPVVKEEGGSGGDEEEGGGGGPLDAVRAAVNAAVAVVADAAAGGAADGEAVGNGSGIEGLGGAGGLSFEEFVVLRSFATAPTLEEQYRFLWHLYDRDGDGILSRTDLSSCLELPAARLGWDDATTNKWLNWIIETISGKAGSSSSTNNKPIGPDDLRSALRKSSQLRVVMMAREPMGGGLLFRQPSRGAPRGLFELPSWLRVL